MIWIIINSPSVAFVLLSLINVTVYYLTQPYLDKVIDIEGVRSQESGEEKIRRKNKEE
jgi:hypothetical protein